MLGESRQKDVPVLVSGGSRLGFEQPCPGLGWLPPVLLQELRDETPPQRVVRTGQEGAEPLQGQRLVGRSALHSSNDNGPSPPRLIRVGGTIRVDGAADDRPWRCRESNPGP